MMAAGPLVAGGDREYPHILLWLVGIARRIELACGHREANQIINQYPVLRLRPHSLVATLLSGYDPVIGYDPALWLRHRA